METINKGEMLSRIFARMDELNLHAKMRKLFLKNGMSVADLTELRKINPEDVLLWQKWYRRNNRLMSFTTYTILEK